MSKTLLNAICESLNNEMKIQMFFVLFFKSNSNPENKSVDRPILNF